MAGEITITIDDDYDTDGKLAGDRNQVGSTGAHVDDGARRAYNGLVGQRRQAEGARILTQLSQVRAEMDRAQREIEWAQDQGDPKASSTAARELSRLASYEVGLEGRKAALDSPVPDRDPVQDYIAGRTPETQAWLRRHPAEARALALQDVGIAGADDARRAAKLQAAHQDAIAEGHQLDSPSYFSHVERHIGAPSSARGSTRGSTGSASSGSGTRVTLTPGEVKAANDLVWTESDYRAGRIKDRSKIGESIGTSEYARRKIAMQKDGYYDRLEG